MGEKIVKNYPSPRLMETIGATKQTAAEAIGELVANCFDARLGNSLLNITIDVRNSKIIVLDNGNGMTASVLEKAVCIGEDMSKYIEKGEGTKGHFGMGFKTSCSTLGHYYEIYTRPYNGDVEYHVAFDINEYSTRPSGSDAWDVTIEDSKPNHKSPLKDASHGTAFVISMLKTKTSNDSIFEYMGEAFKGHLANGDKITLIDDAGPHEAQPKKYDFIPGTRVDIDETFGPKNKYHITGWMALDKVTHNNGLYGFNIYRYKQLVVTNDKSWFRAHLMTSRIIGEVNMDFLDATFYKQGVQQSEDWIMVQSFMKEYLKPLVSASQNISKKGNVHNPTVLKSIIKDLRSDYNIAEPEESDKVDSNINNSQGANVGTKINDTIKNVVSEESLTLEDGLEIKISFFEKEDGGIIRAPFDYIFSESDDENKAELQVMVFKNHPLWKKKIDDEIRKILATSDAIYRVLVEKVGIDTSKSLKLRNEWIEKRTRTER